MEVIGGLLIASGGMTAAAGAAGAATAATAGTAALSTLQAGAGVFQVLTGFAAANARKKSMEAEANEMAFAKKDVYIAGAEEQRALYDEMANTISSQNIAFAASGVSLSSSSVKTNRERVVKQGKQEVRKSKLNTRRNIFAIKRNVANVRAAASNVMKMETVNAIGTAINTGASIAGRGGPGTATSGDPWAGLRG